MNEIWPKDREPYHGDIQQGALGNCFLIAALQSIASGQPQLLKKIIQTSPLRCCFHRQGELVEIPIVFEPVDDDYQYCRSTIEHIQWPYIIEQGYAQLYGGRFENLSGGNTSESFYDLLGLPVDEIDCKELGLLEKIETGFREKNILVTAGFIDTSTRNQETVLSNHPNGIVKNHAYVILGTYNHLPTREKYLVFHNPHGVNHLNNENARIRQAFVKTLTRQHASWAATPGTQLISWVDAKTSFNRVQICHLNAQSRRVIKGEWSASSAGGCSNFSSFFKNPFFILPASFPKKSLIILGHREDQRVDRSELATKLDYPQIGLTLVRLKKHKILSQDNIEVIKQSRFWNKREIQFQIDVERRNDRQYALVMSTYNPNIVAPFWLEIFSLEMCPNIDLKVLHHSFHETIDGEWTSRNAGGRKIKTESQRFYDNPAYQFNLSEDSIVYFVLQQTFETFVPFEQNHPIGLYILPSKTQEEASFVKARSISLIVPLKSNEQYFLVPASYEIDSFGKYQIDIYSDSPINVDKNESKLPIPTPIPSPVPEPEKVVAQQPTSNTKPASLNNQRKPLATPIRRGPVQRATKRSDSPTKKIPLSLATARSMNLVEEYRDLE